MIAREARSKSTASEPGGQTLPRGGGGDAPIRRPPRGTDGRQTGRHYSKLYLRLPRAVPPPARALLAEGCTPPMSEYVGVA